MAEPQNSKTQPRAPAHTDFGDDGEDDVLSGDAVFQGAVDFNLVGF